MLSKILAVLSFLRITDESDKLSLTNIALAIILYRICTMQSIESVDLISFAVALAGYQGKRLISKLPSKAVSAIQQELGSSGGIDDPDDSSVK